MRTPCKYTEKMTYNRFINGELKGISVNECFAVLEPFECTEQCKEKCDKYKPANEENKLKWSYKYAIDGTPYKVCARCGWHYELVEANYCPHCGYEYESWDGTTFK